jgi:hypothetical protein
LECIRVSFTNFKCGLFPWVLTFVFTIGSNNGVHGCGDPSHGIISNWLNQALLEFYEIGDFQGLSGLLQII